MEDFYKHLRDKAFPDGFEVLKNIKDSKSIRMKILKIRQQPETQIVKQAIWIDYIKHQYETGILSSDEYMDLRDWKIKW